MSVKTVLVEIEETALESIKAAGHIIESVFINESQKFVAELKQMPVAATAMNLISALENHQATGASKMDILVGAVTVALQQIKDAGGLKGLVLSLANLAKEFAQSMYNDWKAAAAPLVLKAEDALKAA